jgi:hypothetical protein
MHVSLRGVQGRFPGHALLQPKFLHQGSDTPLIAVDADLVSGAQCVLETTLSIAIMSLHLHKTPWRAGLRSLSPWR